METQKEKIKKCITDFYRNKRKTAPIDKIVGYEITKKEQPKNEN